MSVSAPRGPLAPPDKQFWQRYSPHYEFPLSSVGSVAVHVGMLAIFVSLLWLLAKLTTAEKTPVPITALIVVGGEASGDGVPVGEPGQQQERNEQLPSFEQRHEAAERLLESLPSIPTPDPSLRPEDLPGVITAAKLPEAMRNALARAQGEIAKQRKGGVGDAPKSKKDASSSSKRAVRWELNFKTEDGKDYLAQLKCMKATLVIPVPKDWREYKVYKDLGKSKGEAFNATELPGLYFVDDDATSAGKLAKAMGLGYSPPQFLAFFPKDIEEELAAKERAYRNRKESEIFSTRFRILVRDGKPSITVIDQVPVKR